MFIIIWGIRTRKKNLNKYSATDTCGVCSNYQTMQVFMIYEYFHIFFIPVVIWGKKYFLVCPRCGASRQISKEEFIAIKNNQFVGAQVQIPTDAPQQILNSEQIQNVKETVISKPVQQENKIDVSEEAILKDIEIAVSKTDKEVFNNDEKLQQFFVSLNKWLMSKYKNETAVKTAIKKHFNM